MGRKYLGLVWFQPQQAIAALSVTLGTIVLVESASYCPSGNGADTASR